jgi:rare lipoprotein A
MQRPMRTIIAARRARVAAGALILAAPASTLALGAQPSSAASAVQLRTSSTRIRYGQRLSLSGSAGSEWAGQAVELELRPAGGRAFLALQRVLTGADGSFSAVLALHTSGALRAIPVAGGGQQSSIAGSATAASAPAPSAPEPVSVSARLRVRPRTLAVIGGRAPELHGRLLPGRAQRLVVLLGRRRGRWVRLSWAHTGARGGFTLRLPASLSGSAPLRVRFPGDRLNGRAQAVAGRAVVYRAAVASWYDDAGSTACGFHARYGVANLSLPCGARVSFSYGGRTVTATVDDRGPYVAGRTWDLNQNTAAALAFAGVASVWYSVR